MLVLSRYGMHSRSQKHVDPTAGLRRDNLYLRSHRTTRGHACEDASHHGKPPKSHCTHAHVAVSNLDGTNQEYCWCRPQSP